MVHRGQYSDDSDSDWDTSMSQTVPPPPTPPPLVAESTTTIQPDRSKTNQLNEIVRPSSDSSRSIGARKGPLTFIDRQLNDGGSLGSPAAIKSSTRDSSPVVILKKESPVRAEVFDEDFPVNIADVKDLEFQAIPTSQAVRTPLRIRPNDAISTSCSDGFDNVAFEVGSCETLSPPPARRSVEEGKPVPSIQTQLPKPDETIEIFPYDKTNTEFNQVLEKRRRAKADGWSETAFQVSSRFCSEIAAVIGLPFIIVLAVFLQTLRFVTAGLLRPLLIGLVMGISDGLLKPTLAALHNGVIAPLAAFLHNFVLALKTALVPLAGILVLLTEPLGRLIQSCRLIDIHHHHKPVIRDA